MGLITLVIDRVDFTSQYIGNQAKHQLVKNANNTIIGFRNLLGKKYVFTESTLPLHLIAP